MGDFILRVYTNFKITIWNLQILYKIYKIYSKKNENLKSRYKYKLCCFLPISQGITSVYLAMLCPW